MKTIHKCGFSLVEIMVAIVTLLSLVLGGAAVMYQTGGGVQRQQSKREAVMAANRMLERYWNTTYADLGKEVGNPVSDKVDVNGNSMPFELSVDPEATDSDGGTYYAIKVSIQYMADDVVELETRRYKRGLSKAAIK